MQANQEFAHIHGDLKLLHIVLKQICVPKDDNQALNNHACLNVLRSRMHSIVEKQIKLENKLGRQMNVEEDPTRKLIEGGESTRNYGTFPENETAVITVREKALGIVKEIKKSLPTLTFGLSQIL